MTPEMEERPHDLLQNSQLVETGYGKVYVRISYDEGDPDGGGANALEVFVDRGHSGGLFNSFVEAMSMTLSVALRSGADPYELAEKLQGIRSPRVGEDNGDTMLSIPDAVGVAMERHLEGKISESVRDEPPGQNDFITDHKIDTGEVAPEEEFESVEEP